MANTVKLKDGSYIDSSGVYDTGSNKTLETALSILLADGAGAHNSLYRGKYLGSTPTTEQYAAISAGTFKDLYIGDYWTINGVNYRIAAFQNYNNCGETATTTHHVVIVPDTALYNATMNATNITTGGYVGSVMYKTNLATAKTTIKAAFSGHVLSHRICLTNAVSNGKASGVAWYDSEVDLMNEQMAYGCGVFSPVSDGSTVPASFRVEKSQLPLFALNPGMIGIRAAYWLRDIVSATFFATVDDNGFANCYYAGASLGVRPAFCIY